MKNANNQPNKKKPQTHILWKNNLWQFQEGRSKLSILYIRIDIWFIVQQFFS